MRKLTGRQCSFAPIFVVAVLLSHPVIAQSSGSGSTPWGSYSYQVTQGTNPATGEIFSTTILVGATFTTSLGNAYLPSTSTGALTPIALTLTQPVHEVHGNITLTVVGSGNTNGNGSIIAQLKDSASNNCIAAVKMQQTGPAIVTMPISGKFNSPFSVSDIYLDFYVDEPGEQVFWISLTMD